MKSKILFLFLVMACGRGPNPIKDYDLNSVPRHDTPPTYQHFAATALSIHIPSSLSAINPQFTEGVKGQTVFQVTGDPRVKSFDLQILEGPGKMLRHNDDASLFTYEWNPPYRTVSEGGSKIINLVLLAKVTSTDVSGLASASEPTAFSLVVSRVNSAPKIVGLTLSDDEGAVTKMDAGQIKEFKVIVEDPSATEFKPPQILDVPCEAVVRKDRPQFDGSSYVSTKEIHAIGEGRFEATVKLDLQTLQIPVVPKVTGGVSAESVDLCFDIYSQNLETGLPSAAQRRVVNVSYVPKNPVITLNSAERIVRAGQVASVDFSVDATTEAGDLKIQMKKAQVFPSDTNFSCTMPNPDLHNSQSCTFSWFVPDDEAVLNKSYTFSVEATHEVTRNGKILKLSDSRSATFRVQKMEIKVTNPTPKKKSRRTDQGKEST